MCGFTPIVPGGTIGYNRRSQDQAAELCSGSTGDFGSLSPGSNPGSAAIRSGLASGYSGKLRGSQSKCMILGQGISRLPSSQGLRDSVDLFLLSRRVENCSTWTLVSYERWLRRFLRFAEKAPEEIRKTDIELYVLTLQNKGCSPHYVKSSYRNLRVFFSWMVTEELIPTSPMKNMRPPRVPKNEGLIAVP